jgi:hypothetical protein
MPLRLHQHHHALAGPRRTRRLPQRDSTIERLPPEARAELARVWEKRAASELSVGAQFALLARNLFSEPATPEVRALLARAVSDEAKHSEICREVAARYAGSPIELPVAERREPIVFGDSGPRISLLLELVLLSCCSEVVATFWLREALGSARAPLARAATRELLADDVEHARIGWAHLSSSAVSGADKGHVAGALPTLLRITHASWCGIAERTETFFAEHGCPGRSAAKRAFFAAAEQVILPGMVHVGVDPAAGARWLADLG